VLALDPFHPIRLLPNNSMVFVKKKICIAIRKLENFEKKTAKGKLARPGISTA